MRQERELAGCIRRELLPMLLSIGQRLAEPVAAERKVADNALRDRLPGVRRFNLRETSWSLAGIIDGCGSPRVLPALTAS